jgi:hypothetical protein
MPDLDRHNDGKDDVRHGVGLGDGAVDPGDDTVAPTYRRTVPPGSSAWFWLRVFGIAETQASRERLIVVTSAAGITMTTVFLVIILVIGSS